MFEAGLPWISTPRCARPAIAPSPFCARRRRHLRPAAAREPAAGAHDGAPRLGPPHGIASLSVGDAARRKLPMAPEELLEAGVLVYLAGLGFPGAKAAAAR
jgi:hypothetical protein